MAFEKEGFDISQFTAADDYTTATCQFQLVHLTTAGTVKLSTANTLTQFGILQDLPSSGQAARVRVLGVSKGRVMTTSHAAIGYYDKLTCSTAGNGGLDHSTAVSRTVVARSLDSLAANTTGIITVLITQEGAGSSGGVSAV